jgi:hypothetical protein
MPPGAFRRPLGPKTNEIDKPRNLKELIEQERLGVGARTKYTLALNTWADLGGSRTNILSCYIPARPIPQGAHERALDSVSGEVLLHRTLVFKPDPFLGSQGPGPAVGPGGPKIYRKQQILIYLFISPKVCPAIYSSTEPPWGAMPNMCSHTAPEVRLAPPAASAFKTQLTWPRTLLRIRPGIFNVEADLGLKLGQAKSKISKNVPTNRNDSERFWPDFSVFRQ